MPDQTKLTTAYTERAVSFIEKNKAQPFFVYLAHSMPHVPLFVSNKHAGKSGHGLHGDVIMEIDWSVGQILDTLARLKLDEQTLVIFTSDNGPWLLYGDHAGSAGPLREGKATAFDGGVRVQGGNYPAQIWAAFMKPAHENVPVVEFTPPDDKLWPKPGRITEEGRKEGLGAPEAVPGNQTATTVPGDPSATTVPTDPAAPPVTEAAPPATAAAP